MTTRTVDSIIEAVGTSDGAGVKLRRSLGSGRERMRVDPFLMLDEFFSDNPNDYLAGFPSHPHRGFETVTYMLDGHMEHQDHLGNRGDLTPGSVQWMTAGRGIVHSEMPKQTAGRMRGFQLWINLPAKEKMKPASYRDIPPEEIPSVTLSAGDRVKAKVKLIAGRVENDGQVTQGAVRGVSTDPTYFDIELPANGEITLPLAQDHNAVVYVYEGELAVGPVASERVLPISTAGVLSRGDTFTARAGAKATRFLLLAAKPLNEPVVQYGPFVMNTKQEIEQAVRDFQSGTFVG